MKLMIFLHDWEAFLFFSLSIHSNAYISGIFLKCLGEFADKDILKDLTWDAWVHPISSSEAAKVVSVVNQRA